MLSWDGRVLWLTRSNRRALPTTTVGLGRIRLNDGPSATMGFCVPQRLLDRSCTDGRCKRIDHTRPCTQSMPASPHAGTRCTSPRRSCWSTWCRRTTWTVMQWAIVALVEIATPPHAPANARLRWRGASLLQAVLPGCRVRALGVVCYHPIINVRVQYVDHVQHICAYRACRC